jgi:zinc protease
MSTLNTNAIPSPDDITRVKLDNGIVVLARPNLNTRSVSMSGYFPVGNLFDSDEQLGLASFTADALMYGTQTRDMQAIYDALESVGASLAFSGGTHTTGFQGKALAEDLPLLLSLLSECLTQPSFPQDQVEKLRARLLTGLALRAENTGARANMAFDELVYPAHPYSRPEEGHPESVAAIYPEDLADFQARHYGPRGLVISIVGGVQPEKSVELVQDALGEWNNAEQAHPIELPPVPALKKPAYRRIAIAGNSQSDMVIGMVGPARGEADYIPAAVGNNILGQFGLMGRIGDVVREQAGLAYHASSSLGGGMGPGPWTVSAGVSPANEEKAAELVRSELKRFASEPVDDDELADSKANYIGRLPLSLESNAGVAGALLNLEKYALGLDYYTKYGGMISAITKEDVLAAAAHYIDVERLAVAVAGPKRT